MVTYLCVFNIPQTHNWYENVEGKEQDHVEKVTPKLYIYSITHESTLFREFKLNTFLLDGDFTK